MDAIGSLRLSGKVFLSPMADYTNIAFRLLCKEYGAALVYTELISAKGLLMKSKRTESMLAVSEGEKPAFLQLFGSEPGDYARAISVVEKKFPSHFAGYDLNCGCSVPKALKGKYGCSLMNEPRVVGEVIRAMKSSTEKPVTIKMRLGLSEETFIEVAYAAVDAGADAVALHARFGDQGYSGTADWSKIALLKKSVKVPVLGNGDIRTPADAARMLGETKCDFVLVGRASMGNAFFFSQANAALRGEEAIERTMKDALTEARRFLELVEVFGLLPNDARPYFIGWAKGFAGSSELRNKFATSKTIEEMEKHLSDFALVAKAVA